MAVNFKCEVEIPENLSVEPLHMCIILGNGLQNALEACERMAENKERFIQIRATTSENKLAISIENSFDGHVLAGENGEGLGSVKGDKNHGMGINSIKNTVIKYGGWVNTVAEDNTFILNIVLQI